MRAPFSIDAFRPALLVALAIGLVGLPAAAERRGVLNAEGDEVWAGDIDDDDEEQGPGRRRLRREQRTKQLEEVQRKMHTYLTAELSRKLELDDVKSGQLGEALAAHGKAMRDARVVQKQERKKLKALLRDGAEPSAIEGQLQALAASAAAKPEVQDLLQRTATFLSPKERAELLLAFPGTMKKLRAMRHPRGARSTPHP